MVMVCEEMFPMGSYPGQRLPGFYMEPLLKTQLDFLIKNIKNDWAFTIIISGRGEVRVGKSVLGMQILCYWVYMVNKLYGKNYKIKVADNYVFNGSELIVKGNKLGTEQPFSCIVYDEAGADLQSAKVLSGSTQDVLDYLRECGQYNMLTILILPEFFALPKSIAVTYSTFLIDVDYYANEEGLFERGFYKFYSRPNKKKLYLYGRKELNYDAANYDFRGKFSNVYPVDETEYREAKKVALKKREKPISKHEKRATVARNYIWQQLHDKEHWTINEIVSLYEGTPLEETMTYDVICNAMSEARTMTEKRNGL